MRNLVVAVITLALAAALSACGTKGPLYLPKDKPGATPPAAPAAPAAAKPAAPVDEKNTPDTVSP